MRIDEGQEMGDDISTKKVGGLGSSSTASSKSTGAGGSSEVNRTKNRSLGRRKLTKMDFYTKRASSPLNLSSSVIRSLNYETKETPIQKHARKCFNRAHSVVLDAKKTANVKKVGELSGVKMTQLRALFAYHDEDNDGYIDKRQLRALIQALGYIPSDSVMNMFMRTFPAKKGQEWHIRMADFLKGSENLTQAGDGFDMLMELFGPFLDDKGRIPKDQLVRLLNGFGTSRLGAREAKDFLKGTGYYNNWQELDSVSPERLIDMLIFEF